MKLFTKLTLAVSLLAVVSCAKEKEQDLNPGGPLIAVIADNDDPETRIAIDSDGNFTWSSDDKIAIHYSSSYADCSVNTSGVVTFSQTSATRNYYAVYPSSIKDASNYGNPNLNVNLPTSYDISTQVANNNYTYSPLPMVAVNDPDETLLQFRHVGGLLRITIPANSLNTNTKKIAVTLDKGVTGSFKVSNPGTTAPSISAGSSSSTVTFTITGNTSIGEAKKVVLNLPLPTGTYNSVTIKQQNNSGTVLYTTVHSSSFTIVRAHGKKLSDSNFMQYLEVTGDGLTLSGTELLSGADKILTVKSWKNTSTAVGWKAMVYTTDHGYVDHDSNYWPDWLSLSAYEGSGGTAGERVHVYVDRNQPAGATVGEVATATTGSVGYNDYQRSGSGGLSAVRNATAVGSVSAPQDLSKYNIYGQLHSSSNAPTSITTAGSSTANCYVVNAGGYYCFPIVYGNAYTNNSVNSGAYSGMKNADGKEINNAQILSDGNLAKSGPYEAVIVWQDVQPGWEMLGNDDITVINTPPGGISGCKYIQFYIDKARIVPGNIVIALKDVGKNKILWSWHIWVSRTASGSFDDFKIYNISVRAEGSGDAYNAYMLNCNLGWTPPLKYTKTGGTTARSAILKFVPTSGYANPVEKTVSQPAVASSNVGTYTGTYYSCCYYQWGRKDPFLPSNGTTSNKSVSAGPGFTVTSGGSSVPTANYSATPSSWIQHPEVYDNTSTGVTTDTNYWNKNSSPNDRKTAVKKSVYDPCPAGFSVPRGYFITGTTSDGFSKNGKNTVTLAPPNGNGNSPYNKSLYGFYAAARTDSAQPLSYWVSRNKGDNAPTPYNDRTGYFPAAGHRVGGGIDGSQAHYWTAARYNTDGSSFVFQRLDDETMTIHTTASHKTHHAFLVRPVVEEL